MWRILHSYPTSALAVSCSARHGGQILPPLGSMKVETVTELTLEFWLTRAWGACIPLLLAAVTRLPARTRVPRSPVQATVSSLLLALRVWRFWVIRSVGRNVSSPAAVYRYLVHNCWRAQPVQTVMRATGSPKRLTCSCVWFRTHWLKVRTLSPTRAPTRSCEPLCGVARCRSRPTTPPGTAWSTFQNRQR